MAAFDLNVRLEEEDDNGDAGFDVNIGNVLPCLLLPCLEAGENFASLSPCLALISTFI